MKHVWHAPQKRREESCREAAALFGVTLLLMVGCDNSIRTPASPTPPVSFSPGATFPRPFATNVLSGAIVEVTARGPIPVEGQTVYLMTCGTDNCPDVIAHSVKSDKNGIYRIERVFGGNLNFLWVRDEIYDVVNPMAAGTCPDYCDRVVTVNGDTTLNLQLVRR